LEIVSHNGLDIEVYDLRPADYTKYYYYYYCAKFQPNLLSNCRDASKTDTHIQTGN